MLLFQQADSVLRRHGPTKIPDHAIDEVADVLTMLQELSRGQVFGLENIEVQIAITDVTKPDDLEVRVLVEDDLFDGGEKGGCL